MKRLIRNGLISVGAASIAVGATLITGAVAWYSSDLALKKLDNQLQSKTQCQCRKCKYK